MQLVTQSYDTVELQQVRMELERRNIAVHISDEFMYAIPGMPGAEKPRGIWVDEADLLPAQRVVTDLLGPDRVARPNESATAASNGMSALGEKVREPLRAYAAGEKKLNWWWIIIVAVALAALLSGFSR